MEFKLSAQLRETGEKISKDQIPAVLYGKGIDNKVLKVQKNEFEKLFEEAGESNLINLEVDSEKLKVLIKDIQRDVIKHTVSHIDFYQVNMKDKLTTEIPLNYIGDSKAVKELNAMLIKDFDSVEVSCLPSDLVDHIDVDITPLKEFDDTIRLEDLNLPKGIEFETEYLDTIVVSVREPRVIEDEPVENEEAIPEEKEGEDKKVDEKKEVK
ncbi:MAG: 50S ribosomal protein L25 [Patescibacteria group bacterium]|jgi:large subunit ribosomal protein L25|nr:50S ribosomal protein L25 [Patescibacteria group bacterium]